MGSMHRSLVVIPISENPGLEVGDPGTRPGPAGSGCGAVQVEAWGSLGSRPTAGSTRCLGKGTGRDRKGWGHSRGRSKEVGSQEAYDET